MKYVDPDGRDIRESPFDSKSVAALGALTGSASLAKDSEGNYAIFVKVEVGIGFGGDIYKIGDILKTFDFISNCISNLKGGYDVLENLISTPEDTGQGNFSDLPNFLGIFSFRHENSQTWKENLPTEAAVIVGATSDDNGNTEITVGASVIAATYLLKETVYFILSSIIDYCRQSCEEDK